eukprot:scaffold6.g2811.t1
MECPPASVATPLAVNREVDNTTSPLVQELLRRTEEKKEQRKKERLQDYYKQVVIWERNFKEYMDFEAGNIKRGNRDGLDPETQRRILQWIDENK